MIMITLLLLVAGIVGLKFLMKTTTGFWALVVLSGIMATLISTKVIGAIAGIILAIVAALVILVLDEKEILS